jgi:hypothetical protein
MLVDLFLFVPRGIAEDHARVAWRRDARRSSPITLIVLLLSAATVIIQHVQIAEQDMVERRRSKARRLGFVMIHLARSKRLRGRKQNALVSSVSRYRRAAVDKTSLVSRTCYKLESLALISAIYHMSSVSAIYPQSLLCEIHGEGSDANVVLPE